jgi:hypothetical protein
MDPGALDFAVADDEDEMDDFDGNSLAWISQCWTMGAEASPEEFANT